MGYNDTSIKEIDGAVNIQDNYDYININDSVLHSAGKNHVNGISERHLASDINNDSSIPGDYVKDALEKNQSDLANHITSLIAHLALNLIFDPSGVTGITANDIQNAIEQVNTRVSSIIADSGTSSTEVVDSRNSTFWGQIFTVLGDRLEFSEETFGRIYPDTLVDLEMEHNLSRYPSVNVFRLDGGFGLGGFGDTPFGGTNATLISSFQENISVNSLKIIIPSEYVFSNPTLNPISNTEYTIIFSDSSTSLHVLIN